MLLIQTLFKTGSQDFPHCVRAMKLEIVSIWMKPSYSFRTVLGLPTSKKGEDCNGGKRSKDRLTVALCASFTIKLFDLTVCNTKRTPHHVMIM